MPDVDRSLHVVLVEPRIHWNTGNSGRSCLAAGAQLHLIEPLGFSLEAKQVRRAGLDYWPRVAPRLWGSWKELEAELPRLGEPFIVSPEARTTLWDREYPNHVVLVFGKETDGLPDSIRANYRDNVISIPMKDPQLRSLNLSTSVGIATYEVVRQWRRRDRAAPTRPER